MTELRVESAATPTTDHVTPAPLTLPTPAELTAFFPQLEVLELIGLGGMGAVYAVRQIKLDRLAALKIIRPASATDAAFAERFLREARLLAKLNHPKVVTVFDFGEVEHLCFIVMEHVDGESLRQRMRGGKLPPSEALAIARQICEALQFAHEAGIVHRDIKPENILLDKRGRVKLADFGLAKLAGDVRSPHTLTGTHQVMGTLRYMAPEQMEGARHVDHRADIYSLGVVIYEMLTGELPLGRFDPPSSHAPVDQRLDEVVLRSLAKDPAKRFQQIGELLADLNAFTSEKKPRTFATTLAVANVSKKQESHSESVRREIRAPALLTMFYGLLIWPLVFLAGMHLCARMYDGGMPSPPWKVFILIFAIGVWVAIQWCGWNALHLRNFRLAVIGGVLSLPIGLWLLDLLRDPKVRAAFSTGRSWFW